MPVMPSEMKMIELTPTFKDKNGIVFDICCFAYPERANE